MARGTNDARALATQRCNSCYCHYSDHDTPSKRKPVNGFAATSISSRSSLPLNNNLPCNYTRQDLYELTKNTNNCFRCNQPFYRHKLTDSDSSATSVNGGGNNNGNGNALLPTNQTNNNIAPSTPSQNDFMHDFGIKRNVEQLPHFETTANPALDSFDPVIFLRHLETKIGKRGTPENRIRLVMSLCQNQYTIEWINNNIAEYIFPTNHPRAGQSLTWNEMKAKFIAEFQRPAMRTAREAMYYDFAAKPNEPMTELYHRFIFIAQNIEYDLNAQATLIIILIFFLLIYAQ